jgi:hypothetical protein
MRKTSVTALLLAGMIALAHPALAGSDNPQSFSALQGVPAERLSEREMASITGQGVLSSLSNAVSNVIATIGAAAATAARKQ